MGRSPAGARTSRASGLFSFHRVPELVGLLIPAVALLLAACGGTGAGPGTEAAPAPSRTMPPITSEETSPGAEAEAAQLLSRARIALEADSMARARELARRVVERHPGAAGASEGLWIVARTALAQDDPEVAARTATRLLEILPSTHSLIPQVRVVQGDALARTEAWEEAAVAYLDVGPEAADSIRRRALDGVRAVVREASFSTLELLATRPEAARWQRLLAPVAAEYALALHVRDRGEEADIQAARAVELGAEGDVAALARSIRTGEVEVERRSTALVGVILPRSGSPGQQEFAGLIEEGIRARLGSDDRGSRVPVTLEVQDDSGAVEGVARLVGTLGALEAVGIVGPLGERSLEAAARAREAPVPMVSPTARLDPEGMEAVYSLGAPDPGAAVGLARFAVSRELETAIVLHQGNPEFTYEADTFVEAFESRGGRVLRRIGYEPGSTFFEAALGEVREVLPEALILPVPAGDIELLAPQITFFGLDTLGVRILGTEGWGDPSVIRTVDSRHTDGVVLATPRPPGGEAPGWEAFVEDYEDVLQQTLRSRVPALGYDAAGLLMAALATGAREPAEVARALEGIQDYPGATGSLSIRDGRVVRTYHLVRLRDREMIPVPLGDP